MPATTRLPIRPSTAPTPRVGLVWLAALSLLLSSAPAPADSSSVDRSPGVRRDDDGPTEYELKAAFLLRFTRYVTWPKHVFDTPKSPVVIWVVGGDPLGSALDDAVRGQKLGNRTYQVRRIATVKAALAEKKLPHVLFVGTLSAKDERKLLSGMAGKPVLVIGERTGMAKRGALINFYLVKGRVRFEINPTAAKKRGIEIGSQLLRLARIVE